MLKRSCFLILCSALLTAGAESIVWDFTRAQNELPPGAPRKWAKITSRGLMPVGKNRRNNSGYRTNPGVVKAPEGAFRIAVTIIPAAPEKALHRTNYDMMLFDTIGYFRLKHAYGRDGKFNGSGGIQLALLDLGGNKFIPVARFGCGNDLAAFHGETVSLPPDREATIELDYDALSRCRLLVDGRVVATATIRGVPAPGRFATIGSGTLTNSGFTGTTVRAAIEYLPLPEYALAAAGARVLRQGEASPVALEFRSGVPGDRWEDLKISGSFAGVPFETRSIEAEKTFKLTVETRLRLGEYPLDFTVAGRRNGKAFTTTGSIALRIVAPPDDGMPIRLWTESEDYAECRRYYPIGFDHVVFMLSSHLPAEESSPIVVGARYADLDNCAAAGNGIRVMDYLDLTAPRLKDMVAANRILDRRGNPRATGKRMIPDSTGPEVVKAMRRVSYASGKLYGAHPAFYGALINTERRDHTAPALDKSAQERYRAATGQDIPPEVDGKLPPPFGQLYGIPAGRVIRDDHPLLVYYRWFWKEGDGMNALNGEMSDALKEGAGSSAPVTMHDPAVRVPPLWGSGGKVDLLNQWVYAYPEPFRVAAVAGELQAMAAGRPGQRAGIMTQMIVKRHELVIPGMKVAGTPAWVKWEPSASYMTTPPGLLREATWAMISRQVDSIMYYGAGSLLPPNFLFTGLRYIDPDSQKALSEVFNGVVKPLGKMLRQLPERRADTAVYENLAACLFAGRGGWGWGREWPSGMLMYRANLAPKTLYDESILHGGLENVKVLFMPHSDVLTIPVAREIEKFQDRGGIVVADRYLAPAITPDIIIDEVLFHRRQGAEKFNADYKLAAAGLLKKLRGAYTPFVSADPEFLTFPRQWKNADYLFVVNDRRTYGKKFGVWKQVMEKGMPHKGSVLVRRKAGAVYELSRGGRVPFETTDDGVKCELDFTTNDGRILLFLDSPIASVSLVTPKSVPLGDKLKLRVEIRDASEVRRGISGRKVPALLPVSITLTPPEGGKPETFCDCVKDGVLEREFLIPLNERTGTWTVVVRDRASQMESRAIFDVKGR